MVDAYEYAPVTRCNDPRVSALTLRVMRTSLSVDT